jgi:hypothetical protein
MLGSVIQCPAGDLPPSMCPGRAIHFDVGGRGFHPALTFGFFSNEALTDNHRRFGRAFEKRLCPKGAKRYADRQMRRPGVPRRVSVEGGRVPSPWSPRPLTGRAAFSHSLAARPPSWPIFHPPPRAARLLVVLLGAWAQPSFAMMGFQEVRTALVICSDLGRCAAPLSVA